MRDLPAEVLAALASPQRYHYFRVLVEDPDGNMGDVSDLLGHDFLAGFSGPEVDIDQLARTLSLRLRREFGTPSQNLVLSPPHEASVLNRNEEAEYAPRIDNTRRIEAYTAILQAPGEPDESDWRMFFAGTVTGMALARPDQEFACIDRYGPLLRLRIQTARKYSGTAETVLQAIIDDNWAGGPTLDVPVSPGVTFTEFEVAADQSLGEALAFTAERFGWSVRYRWSDVEEDFALTLFFIDPEEATPVFTFPPGSYFRITRYDIDSADIVNRIGGSYLDGATGKRVEATPVEDADSIVALGGDPEGVRYGRIDEDDDSPIRSGAEWTAMASAALAAVVLPPQEVEWETLWNPFLEEGDVVSLAADGQITDVDQVCAIKGFSGEVAHLKERMLIRGRARPAGAYYRWRQRIRADNDLTFVDAFGVLDEDDGDFYLVPGRTPAALSVIYTVTTDGSEPPDPLGPDGPGGLVGTVSTADAILVATAAIDGTRIRVKYKAARNADGTGTKGPIKYAAAVFSAADDRPQVTWRRKVPSPADPAGIEAVMFEATDDSNQVAIWIRQYTKGASPPAWAAATHRFTDASGTPAPAGFAADPLAVPYEVTRPAEGATPIVVEFFAEDADGNVSGGTLAVPVPKAYEVDGDTIPSGVFEVAIDRDAGIVKVTPVTTDPDSGSWRFRVVKQAVGTNTFADPAWATAGDEFAGNAFGAPVVLTGYPLVRGEQLNISGYFLRTTSTVNATQQASTRSPNVRAQAVQGVEPGNSIRIIDHQLVPVVQAGVAGFNIAVTLLKGDLCNSVRISGSFIRANGTALQPPPSATINFSHDEDLVVQETRLYVEDGFGANLFVSRHPEWPDDGTADSSVRVRAVPYTGPLVAGVVSGTAGEEHQTLTESAIETGSVGIRLEDDAGLVYSADQVVLSPNFTVTQVGGRPRIEFTAADSIAEVSAAAGVTVDGLLIKDGGIPAAAVTAHEAALTIDWSQITGVTLTWAQIADAIAAQGVHAEGGVGGGGGTWAPDFDDGPSQTATATVPLGFLKPTNMSPGHGLNVVLTTGGNTVTFNGADFDGPALNFPGFATLSVTIKNYGAAKYWVDVVAI